MRTTLDLDTDLLQAAKEMAAIRGLTAGQMVSQLLRKALAPSADPPKVRNGVPLLRRSPGGVKITMAMVNELRDEE